MVESFLRCNENSDGWKNVSRTMNAVHQESRRAGDGFVKDVLHLFQGKRLKNY